MSNKKNEPVYRHVATGETLHFGDVVEVAYSFDGIFNTVITTKEKGVLTPEIVSKLLDLGVIEEISSKEQDETETVIANVLNTVSEMLESLSEDATEAASHMDSLSKLISMFISDCAEENDKKQETKASESTKSKKKA